MKKTLLIGFIFIILGFITGKTLYYKLGGEKQVFSSQNTYYFLQERVYSSEENMNENTKKINAKLISNSNGKYYVYLGITKNLENAKKIEKLYKEKGYNIYIKECSLSNNEFSANVEQFDKLIEGTNKLEDILTIQEVVLSNYEEIINNKG